MRILAGKVRAGVYCRISDDRDGTGLGVERQRVDCEQLAARLGWVVADVYIDNDASAYSGKRRPQYERLLEDLRSGRLSGVLTWHPDRLNRSPKELELLIDVLERRSVLVHSVTAGLIDLSTPSGRAFARSLGVWARFESDQKSTRIRRKQLELAMAGTSTHGPHRPWGYADDWVTIVPAEAKLIREGVRRVLAGEPVAQLRKDFTRRGITTPEGNAWHASSLALILASSRIAGWRDTPARKGTRPITGTPFLAKAQWPGIVSRRDVERVRAMLDRDTLRARTSSRYLLSGIMLCSRCEVPMTVVHNGRGEVYYRCARGQQQLTAKCGRMSIVGRAETDIVAALHVAVKGGLIRRILMAGDDAFAGAPAALQADELRLRDLDSDYERGDVSRDRWLIKRRCYNRRLMGNRRAADDIASIERLRELRTGRAFTPAWSTMAMTEKRTMLRTLCRDIRVMPHPGRPGAVYSPERIVVTWRA